MAGRHEDERHAAGPGAAEIQNLRRYVLLAVDQHRVGAGLGIGQAPTQRFVLAATDDQRLGAGDDEHGARRLGGGDLALKFADRDELLPPAGPQTRVIGKGLVLDDDGGDARGVNCGTT